MTRMKAMIAVLAIGAFAAAGCSSSSSGSTTTAAPATTAPGTTAPGTTAPGTTVAASGVDAAKAAIEPYMTEQGTIGVTIPLTSKPEKKKLAWLECELESCQYETVGMKEATAALGWDLLVIASKSADPGPSFQQAIDQGADFIASSGEAPALYADQAKAAAAKGIKILSCYDTTLPDGPNSNIWSQCGDTTFVQKTGPLMANWAIADSNGAAHPLIVSIPDFAVLVAETDAYKAEFKKNCADCKVSELNATIDDLVGGKVPANVAAAIQADPSINYVFFSFGSLGIGVTPALESAGLLSKVKVYGQDFSKPNLDEIVAGTMGAWSADPKAYASWLMVDAAARLSVGMTLDEERAAAALPTFIVADAATAKKISDAGGDWNPPGMADSFKKLWGV